MEAGGQLYARAALPPRKKTQFPVDRRLCESQRRSGRGNEEKKKFNPLSGI